METMTNIATISNTKLAIATLALLAAGGSVFLIAPAPAAINRSNGSECSQSNECTSMICQNRRCVTPSIDFSIGNIGGPTTLLAGGTLEVTSQLCNKGNRAATGPTMVGVTITMPDTTVNSRMFSIPASVNGTCTPIPLITHAPVLQGTIRVRITADPNNVVVESNEENNFFDREITVAVNGPNPVTINGCTDWDPQNDPTILGTIQDRPNGAIFSDRCINQTTSEEKFCGPSGLTTLRATCPTETTCSGGYCQAPSSTPTAITLPDFSFSITQNPTYTTGNLRYTFGNSGSGVATLRAGQTVTKIEAVNAQGAVIGSPRLVAAGNNGTGNFVWQANSTNVIPISYTAPAGSVQIRLTLDPDNLLPESNEANNVTTVSVPQPAQSGTSVTPPATPPAPVVTPTPPPTTAPAQTTPADSHTISFFVTNIGNGAAGANYGGLSGADAFCQNLANTSTIQAARTKRWAAYLSAGTAQNPIHARNRIGTGPWYNAVGELIAQDVATLHATGIASRLIYDNLGRPVVDANNSSLVRGDHDILTGSKADGTLADFPGNPSAEKPNCASWTNGSTGWDNAPPYAFVGHLDWSSRDAEGVSSWNSAHEVPCNAAALGSTAGSGKLYCFAVGNLP